VEVDGGSTGALSKEGNTGRISTECLSIITGPLKRQSLVKQTKIQVFKEWSTWEAEDIDTIAANPLELSQKA
jgi:hypothetical protein